MEWNTLTADERLILEQAVLMARAVKQAGDVAPHGTGGLLGTGGEGAWAGTIADDSATDHQRPRGGGKKQG